MRNIPYQSTTLLDELFGEKKRDEPEFTTDFPPYAGNDLGTGLPPEELARAGAIEGTEEVKQDYKDAYKWLQNWYTDPETIGRLEANEYTEGSILDIQNKGAPLVGFQDMNPKFVSKADTFPKRQFKPEVLMEKGLPMVDHPQQGLKGTGMDIIQNVKLGAGDTTPLHESEHYMNIPSQMGEKERKLIYNAIPKRNRIAGSLKDAIKYDAGLDIWTGERGVTQIDILYASIGKPSEVRANLMEMRYKMDVKPGEKITMGMLDENADEAYAEPYYKLRKFLEIDKKKILELLNTLSLAPEDKPLEEIVYG